MSTTRATPVRLAAILGLSIVIAIGIVTLGFAVTPPPGAATIAPATIGDTANGSASADSDTAVDELGDSAMPAALDGQARGAMCPGRMAATERDLLRTIEGLRRAAADNQAGRCGAYRDHVEVLVAARDTYSSCMAGFARQDTVGQMDLAAANWRVTIAERCGE